MEETHIPLHCSTHLRSLAVVVVDSVLDAAAAAAPFPSPLGPVLSCWFW